jgi:Xaa-Pro aminopeptidase
MMQNKPFLSLKERDRRYKLVRQAMRERGLDALLIWGHSGKWDWHMANIHYMSLVGGNGEEGFLVFPLEGDPTLFIWHRSLYQVQAWLEYGSWITDFHGREDGSFVKPVVKVLKQLKLTTAPIGIPGLFEQDGIMFPSGTFTALREELPKADFRDASGLIEAIRAVKSSEEIALMERSAQIGEAAIDTLAEVARPGVPENEVIAAMFNTMITQGADIPIMFLFDSGRVKTGGGRLAFTRKRILQPRDIIFMEFSARVHGYGSHLNQTAVVGDWPEGCEKLYEAWLASYRAGFNALRPGITVGELSQAFYEALAPTGFKYAAPGAPDGYRYGAVFFHGTGWGNEAPSGSWPIPEKQASIVIREGMTLGFEPGASLLDNSMGVRMGDTVLVTRDGRRRLGTKEPKIVICK